MLSARGPKSDDAVLERDKTSGVAARPREAGDHARAHRVDDSREDDRNSPAHLLQTIGAVVAKTTSGASVSNSAASLRMRSGSELLAPQR